MRDSLQKMEQLFSDINIISDDYIKIMFGDSPFVLQDGGIPAISNLPLSVMPIKIADGWTAMRVSGNVDYDEFYTHAHEDCLLKRHVHYQTETVKVIKGTLRFWMDKEDRLLKAGDVIKIPSFVPHSCKPEGGDVELSVIFEPPITRKQT